MDLPTPAPALETAFRAIWERHMQGVPMVNPALQVEAVGFRPWSHHWLGVLVTPWFMNLVLMPRVVDRWLPIGERDKRHYVFPAGVFEFIGSRDAALGDYQACSLFSPMFEFEDPATARATADAALVALFDAGQRPQAPVPTVAAAPRPATGPAPVATAAVVSKRSFLFGSPPPADRGP